MVIYFDQGFTTKISPFDNDLVVVNVKTGVRQGGTISLKLSSLFSATLENSIFEGE